MDSDSFPEKRPKSFWCCYVSVSPNVQLLFIKVILRAVLRTRGICLVSKKSHSEMCPAYIFLARCAEIHSKHITCL